jgi:hypothetical protein
MLVRCLLLSIIAIQLTGCIATPRLVSNRVSDYEPPTPEQREQREKIKEQLKRQEAQPKKIIVVKPEDTI